MWLWDYIMLIRQRQETRRNVRVPLVYLGIGENVVIMAKVAIFQNRSLYTLAKMTDVDSSYKHLASLAVQQFGIL